MTPKEEMNCFAEECGHTQPLRYGNGLWFLFERSLANADSLTELALVWANIRAALPLLSELAETQLADTAAKRLHVLRARVARDVSLTQRGHVEFQPTA